MKKSIKIWMIIASCCVMVGIGFLAVSMVASGFDYTKMFTSAQFETKTHHITQAFDRISLETKTANIVLRRSTDSYCKVVCYETETVGHGVQVEAGVLRIQVQDQRKWYEYFEITPTRPSVTVYLPQEEYRSLVVKGSTGNVSLHKDLLFQEIDIALSTGNVTSQAAAVRSNIQVTTGNIQQMNTTLGSAQFSTTTGDISLKQICFDGTATIHVNSGDVDIADITAKDMSISTSSGEAVLQNTVAEKFLTVETDTGNVQLDSCDASEIAIETSTGDINGCLRTPKIFFAHSDTGDVSAPDTITGGRCTITSSTGDIAITIERE